MRESEGSHRSIRIAGIHLADVAACVCLAAALVVGAPVSAETGAQLTAVIGDATQGDRSLAQRGTVTEGASIETGEEGNLAMLVDDDAVVELCAKTEMKLLKDEATGTRIIEVGSGTTRIIVDPNADVGSLQIVSPVMVATLMGTEIIITVDPVTKETTIASKDHKLKAEHRDPDIKGSTIVDGHQKLTMKAGEAPPPNADEANDEELEKMAECLKDIHGAAVASSGKKNKAPDRLAAVDGQVTLPPWIQDPANPTDDPPGDDHTDPGIQPTDIDDPVEMMDDMMNPGDDFPDPCGDIPADGCFPFPTDGGV